MIGTSAPAAPGQGTGMRGDAAQRSDPRRHSERPGQPAREVTDARSVEEQPAADRCAECAGHRRSRAPCAPQGTT
jgi:hypothetical protein